MEEKYKNYVIRYSEHNELFEAKIGLSTVKSKRLGELKKKLDAIEKRENKFDRIDILCFKRWSTKDGLIEGQITSIAQNEEGTRCPEVWVVADGERSKRGMQNIYLNNEKNRSINKEINAARAKVKDIEAEIVELYNSMDVPEL